MAHFVFALLVALSMTQPQAPSLTTEKCLPGGVQTGCKPCLRPGSEPGKEVYNKPADVTALELDKSELRIPPKSEVEPEQDAGDSNTVAVATTAQDPEDDELTYRYTISGGRIIGAGANVSWDLKGVMPGTYTITAGIDDGCGICGKTMTQTVKIVQD